MVKLYTRQSLHTTTQLLQSSSGVRAKISSNYTQDKAYILQHSYSGVRAKIWSNFTQYKAYILQHRYSGVRAKIWSNRTQDKTCILQHSYSHTSVELEPKFGQIILKTKPTNHNTATPILQGSLSQNLVKLYTRQNLHTTTQLLPYFSGARAKIWSNYTQDKAYILQHSYSHTSVVLEPKFGQIILKTKPTYLNTATPILQWC